MKLIIQIDLDTDEAKIISKSDLNKKDYILIICEYLGITVTNLRLKPLNRKEEYVLARKLISYFLDKDLNISHYEIGRLLRYSVDNNSNNLNIIGKNIRDIEEGINQNDPFYTRPYNNLVKYFTKKQLGEIPKKNNLS